MDLKDYIRSIPDYPKKGILFRDITTLIKDEKAFEEAINQIVDRSKKFKVEKIAAIESRGFVFASAFSYILKKPFIMLRKKNIYYEKIEDLSGLSTNHPILSISLLVVLFSLAGIPPLAGFFAKFYIFKSVIEQSMYFLAIVGLLSTVVAAFYYLRIIKIMYFDEEKDSYDKDHNLWLKLSLTVSTILILMYFIFPSELIDVVSKINII